MMYYEDIPIRTSFRLHESRTGFSFFPAKLRPRSTNFDNCRASLPYFVESLSRAWQCGESAIDFLKGR